MGRRQLRAIEATVEYLKAEARSAADSAQDAAQQAASAWRALKVLPAAADSEQQSAVTTQNV